MRRRTRGVWALVGSLWLCPLPAQESDEAGAMPDEGPAVTAVGTSLQIETTLLREDRATYAELSARRQTIVTRIEQLRESLDSAVGRSGSDAAANLSELLEQLDEAEGERTEVQLAERALLDRIRDRLRRVVLYEEQLAVLRDRPPPAESGLLTGSWEIVLLPINQRGIFELKQSGTIVTGTYRLAGGFSGSLQGTLVQTKVFLQRIDSQLGRSMELEGRLSGDQTIIRGTWLSYDLSDGDGGKGEWSATRRTASSRP
jgi:hypothetical protein